VLQCLKVWWHMGPLQDDYRGGGKRPCSGLLVAAIPLEQVTQYRGQGPSWRTSHGLVSDVTCPCFHSALFVRDKSLSPADMQRGRIHFQPSQGASKNL
jgi:hypothetical protein